MNDMNDIKEKIKVISIDWNSNEEIQALISNEKILDILILSVCFPKFSNTPNILHFLRWKTTWICTRTVSMS